MSVFVMLAVSACQKSNSTTTRSATQAASTAPTVTPAFGLVAGGTRITVNLDLSTLTAILVGGNPCLGLRSDGANVTSCLTPAGSEGATDLVVQSGSTVDATLIKGFTYLQPIAVTTVTPDFGKLAGGDHISVTGAGFYNGATVMFGDGACTSVTVVSSTTLTCLTPSRPVSGTYDMTIANLDKTSVVAPAAFTYDDPPAIAAISQTTGATAGGTTLSFTGSGFRDGMEIYIGAAACTKVVVTSADSASCIAPAGSAGVTSIVIVSPDGQQQVSKDAFTFVAAPLLSTVSPALGSIHGGTVLTLSGTGFLPGATVTLGDEPCGGVQIASATQITCTTEAGRPGSAAVVVANSDGQKSLLADAFTYATNVTPTISSVIPAYGPVAGDTTLTITGANFAGTPVVTIGGSECGRETVVSSTELTCTTAAGTAGAQDLVVSIGGGYATTLTNGFAYSNGASPVVGALTPPSGPVAGSTFVTINGANFLTGATVSIGGHPCAGATVVGPAALTCTTPSGTFGAADVVVTNPDTLVTTRTGGFAYTNGVAPLISSATPNFGNATGGATVLIQGSGFVAGAVASIGGSNCTTTTLVDANDLNCVAPAGTFGIKNVVVTNVDSQSATLPAAFTYRSGQAPSAVSVTPNSGPLAGGTAVAIGGANFLTGATVLIDGISCSSVSVTPTTITCNTPADAFGGKTVTVVNPDGQATSIPNGFTYSAGNAPTITSVDPNFGTHSGSTTLTIKGSAFLSGALAYVGGASCTSTTYVDASTLHCVTPPGSYGAKAIGVTNPDSQTASVANLFTYADGGAPSILAVYPASGKTAGGTIITVAGANYQNPSVVTVNGVNCTSTTFINSTMLSCVSPPGTTGAKTVALTGPDAQTASLASAYTYTTMPTIDYVESGSVDDARFGSALTAIGDLDGDGVPDLAVSAPLATVSGTAQAGEVFIYSGATGSLLCTVVSPSPIAGGNFGASLASGETNGDAYIDLFVGEPGQTAGGLAAAGKAYIISGALLSACASPPIHAALQTLQAATPEAGANFGFSIAAGLINADTFADAVVGEPNYSNGSHAQGRVSMFDGHTGATLYTALVSPVNTDYANFGYAVAIADMNGDGKGDIVVGEPNAPNSGTSRGRVYAFSGADGSTQLFSTALGGAADGNRFGFSLAKISHINAYAREDVIIGEPYNTTGTGKVYVYGYVSGTVATLLLTISPPVATTNTLFGYSVASAGDVDGDGKQDIVVGQPYENTTCGGSNRGRVLVFGSVLANSLVATCGTENGALAGKAVAGLGDVNGDGFADFIYGEPLGTNGGINRGRATVFLAP